jgi:hypothetical protein
VPCEIDALLTVRFPVLAWPRDAASLEIANRCPGECRSVVRVALDCLLEQTKSVRDPRRRIEIEGIGAQVEIIGGEIVGRLGSAPHGLGYLQCRFDVAGDARCHLVLEAENIRERAIEAFRPKMCAGECIDQLRGDAHLFTRLAHRALEHIAHAKLVPDRLHVHSLTFVDEGRIASDHEQPANAAQRGDDFLDHAVDEILLLRIAAEILKRQYCDRRFVWQGGIAGCWRGRGAILAHLADKAHAAARNGTNESLCETIVADCLARSVDPRGHGRV